MSIEANDYYPKQMNGPVISAFGSARDTEFSNAEYIINYLHNLSIDTADETELENIGRLVGYIRPLVPEGFNDENTLIMGSLPMTQDEDIGLSTVGTTTGGQLSSETVHDTGFMALDTYRKFLKSIAILKRYGITLYSINKVCAAVSTDFTISWDSNNDVNVVFNTNIGYKNIWVLSQLFYKIATTPQILITQSSSEE